MHTAVSALGWVVCCHAALRAPQSSRSRVPNDNEPTGLARESIKRRAASYFFVKLSCDLSVSPPVATIYSVVLLMKSLGHGCVFYPSFVLSLNLSLVFKFNLSRAKQSLPKIFHKIPVRLSVCLSVRPENQTLFRWRNFFGGTEKLT